MKTKIPNCDNKLCVVDGKGAREMHGVCASQGEMARQLASAAFDNGGELDGPRRRPILLPRCLGVDKVVLVEHMISRRGGEGGAYLGVRQSAREGGVTSVPELGGQIASRLVDQQLHEGARVEVDQRHLSATLFADELRHGVTRTGAATPRSCGSLSPFRAPDDAFST